MTITDAQLKKLPKYAQHEIQRLQRDLDFITDKWANLAQDVGNIRIGMDAKFGCGQPPVYFKDETVYFILDNKTEIAIRRLRDHEKVDGELDWLQIMMSGGRRHYIEVRPSSSNVVYIR